MELKPTPSVVMERYTNTGIKYIWYDNLLKVYHFEDETNNLSEQSYGTVCEAQDALEDYCKQYL